MYKAAVIGLGNIGMLYDLEPQRPHPSSHVTAYEMDDEFRLVCGIDGDVQKKKVLNSISQNCMFFSSVEEACKADAFKDIDIVSVCTPPSTHLDIVLWLIHNKACKLIFCEKPIVEDINQAQRLLEVVNKSDIIVVPNISRRWNTGMRKIRDIIISNRYGNIEKINIRYTRGIYNTGAHLFDLLKMWTGGTIDRVLTVGETHTSALPEKTYSFHFIQNNGITGYAEAINDCQYYLFDIDIYCQSGKIEMRNSGDEIRCYLTAQHHLFQGFKELTLDVSNEGLLNDACIKNALINIRNCLNGKDQMYCDITDAIYPLYIANAIEKSRKSGRYEEVLK